MKKIALISIMLPALILMESFVPQSAASETQKGRVGVWKTYEDYANGHLTDLGENRLVSIKHTLTFDKETIDTKETKYWGANVYGEIIELKSRRMKSAIVTWRFVGGEVYKAVISPMPIGVYMDKKDYVYVGYDEKGDVVDLKNLNPIDNQGHQQSMFFYASKGNGEMLKINEREKCRKFFEDDPEILKDFDNDDTFKGQVKTNPKKDVVFLKYAVRYNRKHTPGYKPDVAN